MFKAHCGRMVSYRQHLKRALPQKGFCPSPQSKEDVMSSIFTHLRDDGYDTAIRTLVVLSFAVVLYAILEGRLW